MRRPWRFSLRALFALFTAISVCLGLHVHGTRVQKDAVQRIQEHHGWVAYDFQVVEGEFDPKAESRVSAWLRQLLGVDFFHTVEQVSFDLQWQNGAVIVNRNPDVLPLGSLLVGVPKIKSLRLWGTQVTDHSLEAVSELDELESLIIVEGMNITDGAVDHFKRLSRLKWLVLTESQITDNSLEVFGKLPNLEVLNIESSHLSDNGLPNLSNHKRLKTLFLHGQDDRPNDISNDGIMNLRSIPNLTFLGVKNTQVTKTGASEFMDSCPGCNVQR